MDTCVYTCRCNNACPSRIRSTAAASRDEGRRWTCQHYLSWRNKSDELKSGTATQIVQEVGRTTSTSPLCNDMHMDTCMNMCMKTCKHAEMPRHGHRHVRRHVCVDMCARHGHPHRYGLRTCQHYLSLRIRRSNLKQHNNANATGAWAN